MKPKAKTGIFLLIVIIVAGVWLLYFHNAAIAAHVPQWGWLQSTVKVFGQKTEAPLADDEDPNESKNEIPVHVAHVTTATLHRYIEGYGCRSSSLGAHYLETWPAAPTSPLLRPGLLRRSSAPSAKK